MLSFPAALELYGAFVPGQFSGDLEVGFGEGMPVAKLMACSRYSMALTLSVPSSMTLAKFSSGRWSSSSLVYYIPLARKD